MKQIQCLCLGFTLLSGCAGLPGLPDQSEIENSAKVLASHNQSEALKQLESAKKASQKAEDENLAFYAPQYMQHIKAQLNQALVAAQERDAEDTSRYALATEKWVKAGLATRQLVLSTLQAVLEQREHLLAVKADNLFGPEFNLQMQSLNDLITQVEIHKLQAAKQGQQKLLPAMQALEVRTLLNDAQTLFANALTQGAETLLPQSTLLTRATLLESQKTLAEHARDSKHVNLARQKAQHAAERLLQLSQLARRMSLAKGAEFEAIVLEQEDYFRRLGKALDQEDLTPMGFAAQTSQLEAGIGELKNTTRGAVAKASEAITVDELERWQRKVALLQNEIMRLQRELDNQR